MTFGTALRKMASFSRQPQRSPRPWLWNGYLPRGHTVMVEGVAGAQEAAVILDWIARASVGADWPDGQPGGEPIDVILVSHNLDPDTSRERLQAAGVDESRIAFIDDQISCPQDVQRLRQKLQPHESLKPQMLVVADYGDGFGEGWAAMHLALLARELQLCVVMLKHNVPAAWSDHASGPGTDLIEANSQVMYVVGPNPRDRGSGDNVITCSKINIGPKPPSLRFRVDEEQLMWTGEADVTADAFMSHRDRAEFNEARAFLLEVLSDHESHPAAKVYESARDAGVSPRAMTRALSDLGVDIRSIRGGGTWSWRLRGPETR